LWLKTRYAKKTGAYAVGRALLILDLPDHAHVYLQQAWDKGYQTPDCAFALGRTLGILYQREQDEVVRIASKERREARLKELDRIYQAPALNYLTKSLVPAPAHLLMSKH